MPTIKIPPVLRSQTGGEATVSAEHLPPALARLRPQRDVHFTAA